MEWTRGDILGRGSSATVYMATSTSGDVFAVKSAELSTSEALQREQRFLSILRHPRIVGYNGFNITKENNKLMYNIMIQYMPGGSLVDVSRGRLLDDQEISDYTRQILEGLEYVHSCGIVHCDIKGRNILVDETGAKIADFGCAKWASDGKRLGGGTPMFMAPEVARGEEQGYPADVWALGCTVIEMVSGASPWPNADDQMSVLYRIAFSNESPEIPDVLSDEAKDFVGKCLRRDPKERWTAKQLLKHPFVQESKIQRRKQLHTDSPTSVLDEDVWKSREEWVGSAGISDVVGWIASGGRGSPRQRIKQLAGDLEMVKWQVEVEVEEESSDWMTITRHDRRRR